MTPREACEILNRFLAIDPVGVSRVFNARQPMPPESVPAMIADPTLVWGGTEQAPTLGPLGIINGIFGSKIAAVYPEGEGAAGTATIMRFVLPCETCTAFKCVCTGLAA